MQKNIALTLLFFCFLFSIEADHVIFNKIVTSPSEAELVSIYNPTESAIDLSDYYLSDAEYEDEIPVIMNSMKRLCVKACCVSMDYSSSIKTLDLGEQSDLVLPLQPPNSVLYVFYVTSYIFLTKHGQQ